MAEVAEVEGGGRDVLEDTRGLEECWRRKGSKRKGSKRLVRWLIRWCYVYSATGCFERKRIFWACKMCNGRLRGDPEGTWGEF